MPHRLLWRVRHRRARALVAERQPESVLFVCQGNICRSAFGAAWLSANGGGSFQVRSAGFLAPGRKPPPAAIETAARMGVDLRSHRSALVTADAVESADVILVMENYQRRALLRRFGADGRRIVLLGDLDPSRGYARAIPDPWGRSDAEFNDCFQRLTRCVDVLAEVATPRSAT